MAQFVSYDPASEVSGESVAAFSQGFPAGLENIGLQILEKHGVENLRPGGWYSFQSLLDAMREVSETLGNEILARIGEKVAQTAKISPEVTTLDGFLETIDVTHQLNHKGSEVGHYAYIRIDTAEGLMRAKVHCNTPYPCSFDRGMLEGFANRFKPERASGVVVRGDEGQPCRARGDDTCTYIISWA